MLQVLGNPEIAQFDCVTACEKDILRFEIAMDDLSIVHVLDGQANLCEPGKYLFLCNNLVGYFGLANALTKVAAFSITHDDVEIAILALEWPEEFDDEIAVKCFEYVCLPHWFPNLSLSESYDFDLFEHALLAYQLIEGQVALAIGALA